MPQRSNSTAILNGNSDMFSKLKNIMNFFCKTLLITIGILIINIDCVRSEALETKSVFELQAQLLYNFIDHVTWPYHQSGLENKNLNLCIINDNPVATYLNSIVKNNSKKKSITIIRKYENDYMEDCHVIFINEYYEGYFNRILLRSKDKPILTFSNIDKFAKGGGIVQFTLRNNRVEFILNLKAMRSSGLKISNSIISIADIIE